MVAFNYSQRITIGTLTLLSLRCRILKLTRAGRPVICSMSFIAMFSSTRLLLFLRNDISFSLLCEMLTAVNAWNCHRSQTLKIDEVRRDATIVVMWLETWCYHCGHVATADDVACVAIIRKLQNKKHVINRLFTRSFMVQSQIFDYIKICIK